MHTEQLASSNFYEYLPLVYDAVGLSDYAANRTGVYLEFIQVNGWLGRRVLEFGCGTGVSAEFFIGLGFMVHGIDLSEGMLAIARSRFEGMEVHAEFEAADIRTYKPSQAAYDLVLGLDVMNHVNTIKDLEGVFRRANYALVEGRMFLFDLHTVYGFSQLVARHPTQVLFKNPNTFLAVEHDFDYDLSALMQAYTLFYTSSQGVLQRYEEQHVLRGYALRNVYSLLERTGFAVRHAIDTQTFQQVDSKHRAERILIAAEKVHTFTQQQG